MTGPRSWALWTAPKRVVALVLFVQALAIVLGVRAIVADRIVGADLLRFALLSVLSVAYIEVSRQVDHRRRLFAHQSHTDVTSVWTFAAALLFPGALAAAFVVAVYVHLWVRIGRRGDSPRPYRAVFTGATMVLATLAASGIVHHFSDYSRNGISGVTVVAVIILGMIAARLANVGLVGAAIVLSGGPRELGVLLGSRLSNIVEFTAMGLGTVTATAVTGQAWTAVVVLPAAFLLQHQALMKELVTAATVDSKTELLNAAAWRQIAERELARAERQNASAAVLVIDMDRFKAINDTHGHLAGDVALKAVGEALADELRAYDAVGRFGGEEFVALLPTLDTVAATAVAERIRRRIEDLTVRIESRGRTPHDLTLTASVGVAARADGSTLDDLLNAADEAVYAAKAGGRNTVRAAKHDRLRLA